MSLSVRLYVTSGARSPGSASTRPWPFAANRGVVDGDVFPVGERVGVVGAGVGERERDVAPRAGRAADRQARGELGDAVHRHVAVVDRVRKAGRDLHGRVHLQAVCRCWRGRRCAGAAPVFASRPRTRRRRRRAGRTAPSCRRGGSRSHRAPIARVPCEQDAPHAAVGDDARAGRDRGGQHRARHRLLHRPTVRARSGRRARTRRPASRASRRRVRAPPTRSAARRAAATRRARPRCGRRSWSSCADAELVDVVVLRPLRGELGRQPVIEAAVDLGAPADAPALGVRDRGPAERGARTAVAVLGAHLLQRERYRRVGIDPRAFFEDRDRARRRARASPR